VKGVVLVAKLLGSDLFFYGLGLGRSAVFVGSANVEGVMAASAGVSCEDIGREDACATMLAHMCLNRHATKFGSKMKFETYCQQYSPNAAHY
jgi:hypothetical protein